MSETPISRQNVQRLAGLFRAEQEQALGELLVRRGKIGREQLEEALAAADSTDKPAGQVFVSRGWISPEELQELHKVLLLEERAQLSLQDVGNIPEEARIHLSDASRNFAEFILVASLGRGGAAEVWKAWDRQLGRWVAVKIPIERPGSSVEWERFRTEAQASARLNHPNIVSTFRIAEREGRPYIVMQLVEGRSLEEGRLPLKKALEVMRTIALAVEHAHRQGVLHRDIKPGNIMIDQHDHPWILDFGLAYLLQGNQSMTVTGTVFGTPGYMSPEQASGSAGTRAPATDIYALGATLYELVCGRPPFDGDSPVVVAKRICEEEPLRPTLLNPELPRDIETILLKTLEKEPERRYSSAWEFGEDLRRFMEGEPISARPVSIMYRLRKRLVRHRGLAFVGLGGLLAVSLVTGILLPRWIQERQDRQARDAQLEAQRRQAVQRELALNELNALWMKLVLEKRELYVPVCDPIMARAEIQRALDKVLLFVQKHPELPQGLYMEAQGWLALGNSKRAEQALERALEKQPDFAPAWALLGRVLLDIHEGTMYGQGQGANDVVRRFEQALDKGRRTLAEEDWPAQWGMVKLREDQVAENLVDAMRAYYVEKNSQKARDLLKEAHSKSRSEEYCYWLSQWTQDMQERIARLNEALQIMPYYARGYFARGTAKLMINDLPAAQADLNQALKINPVYGGAYYNRGVLRDRLGDYKGAVEDFTEAVKILPEYADAWYNLAVARINSGDPKGAVAAFSETLKISPDYSPAFYFRGMSRHTLGDYRGALDDYAAGLKLNPKHALYRLQSARACESLAEKEPAEARPLLNQAKEELVQFLAAAGVSAAERADAEKALERVGRKLAGLKN